MPQLESMKSIINYSLKRKQGLFLFFLFICFIPKIAAQSNSQNPDFDLSKSTKEIEQRLRDYENALKNRDSIALSNLYTIDAEILNNGGPSTVGRNNILKSIGKMIRADITGSSFNTTGLWGNNKLLVEQGAGFFAHTNGEVVSRGRYLLIWKNDKGIWKIFRDTWFSDGIITN